jgi:hypothetical protein
MSSLRTHVATAAAGDSRFVGVYLSACQLNPPADERLSAHSA